MALFLSRHRIRVTKRRIEHTFAFGLPDLVAVCPASEHITLVLDNLKTPISGVLLEAFSL